MLSMLATFVTLYVPAIVLLVQVLPYVQPAQQTMLSMLATFVTLYVPAIVLPVQVLLFAPTVLRVL